MAKFKVGDRVRFRADQYPKALLPLPQEILTVAKTESVLGAIKVWLNEYYPASFFWEARFVLVDEPKPHPHRELIIAWANGAEIEINLGGDKWGPCDPQWEPRSQYRIKPEKKPDVVQYFRMRQGQNVLVGKGSEHANLCVTFDGETGELKSVEKI